MNTAINPIENNALVEAFNGHEANPFLQELVTSPVAFLTCHHKDRLLQPIFHESIGLHLMHTNAIDTDLLGSFTREISRQCTQREAAHKKAKLGAKHTGARFGIGSEGAFISDPWFGTMPWNMEIVLLLDTKTGMEIVGFAEGPGMSLQREVRDWESLEQFAAQAGFPNHHLIIRPDDPYSPVTNKGISSYDDLSEAFQHALSKSYRQQVFVENDLRAHCNPTRQAIIINAAKNLIERLHSICPACRMPDFWQSDEPIEKHCRACGKPARTANSNILCCKHCGYTETLKSDSDIWLDPAYCDHCNP